MIKRMKVITYSYAHICQTQNHEQETVKTKSFLSKIFNNKVAVMSLLHHSTSYILMAGMSFGIPSDCMAFCGLSCVVSSTYFQSVCNLSKVRTSSSASALYLLTLRLKPSMRVLANASMKMCWFYVLIICIC
jgi:hypothetical protein